MSDLEAEAGEIIDAGAPADDAAPDEQQAAQTAGLEAEARRFGWRPKEEYKGSAPWIDAEAFVKNGREVLPIVQANNKALEKAVKEGNAKIERLEKTLADFSEYHTKSEARQYERAMKELQAKQAVAVEANDLATVQETTKEIAELTAEAKAEKPAKEADKAPALPPEIAAWQDENPWFLKDPVMRAAAAAIVDELLAEEPNATPKRQIKEVDRRIREEFPNKFENPRRKDAAAVEGASPAGRVGGKTFADLPADAKAMCTQFERDIPGFTRAQYVKDYFA